MNFISTRNAHIQQSLSHAITTGLANDGGLIVPEQLPRIDLKFFLQDLTYAEFAEQVLQIYFANDQLAQHIKAISREVFNFAIPLQQLNDNTFMLELFHGPTASFKDFGCKFLAEALVHLANHQTTTIMVATSGDTGAAVANAFYDKANVNVIILYPKNRISARQVKQITCWDKNIHALAVNQAFDHCQQLVKAAFKDIWFQKNTRLNSANSINIARLLPQITYYAYASVLFFKRYQTYAGFIVPTGNLGNAVAALWAKTMGFPIREIAIATNANKTILNYLHTGIYQAQPTIATLANAMDVGDPSNFERLVHLFKNHEVFKQAIKVLSASDDDIKAMILESYKQYNKIICPHTATAYFARKQLSAEPWIIVATADASKFNDLIEPIINCNVPIPTPLQRLLNKPSQTEIGIETLTDIQKIMLHNCR